MAKINFNNPTNNNVNTSFTNADLDNVKIKRENKQTVTNSASASDLDKVKIRGADKLRVVVGDEQQFSLIKEGPIGPTGPTGPEADFRVTKYFYGTTRPEDARTGDKWFHTEAGLEFTYLNEKWIQLYRNIKPF